MLKKLCPARFFGRETTHTGNVGKSIFLTLPTNLVNMVLQMSQSYLPYSHTS